MSVRLWHAKYKGSVDVMNVCVKMWFQIICEIAFWIIWVINSNLITLEMEAVVMYLRSYRRAGQIPGYLVVCSICKIL